MSRLSALVLMAVAASACSSGSTNGSSSASTAAITTPVSGTPSAGATTAPTAAAAASQWLTFGSTADRRGHVDAGPDATKLSKAWDSAELDGNVYGQPLVLSSGRVLVATEGDSVYALDAATGAVVWRTNLGDPVPLSDLECGNIDPNGITGTPVIDPATGTLYVVALVAPGHHDLVAIDASTGTVRWRTPIDPPGLDPLHEQQRSALTIANGRVYVAYGGLFGDCGPYKGAVVAMALDGTGDPISWIAPTQREAGIWAPGGPAVDAAGDLYAATGNGASTDSSNFDQGNAVVRLTPTLSLADSWAPQDWFSLSATDSDLGSTGPVLLGTDYVFVAGKNGTGYLLAADQLGGIAGQLHDITACASGGAFGGIATDGATVVIGCSSGPSAVSVGGDGQLTALWNQSGGRTGAPVIAGATVWLITNQGHLLALDLASGTPQADVDLGGSIPGFPSPTVVPHAVYAAAGTRVAAFTG